VWLQAHNVYINYSFCLLKHILCCHKFFKHDFEDDRLVYLACLNMLSFNEASKIGCVMFLKTEKSLVDSSFWNLPHTKYDSTKNTHATLMSVQLFHMLYQMHSSCSVNEDEQPLLPIHILFDRVQWTLQLAKHFIFPILVSLLSS
jgi:hypothetical protein